ncbi:heparan-alpha-glucosaminide N-acetyltransferase [archaeon]
MKNRFWEIDAMRGLAVVAMILFHFLFDLNYFAGINVLDNALWLWIPRAIGATFIFLAGIALTLSKSNPLHRGATIFAWGIIITIITYVAFPQATIWFGVLHFIGLGIIVSNYLKKYALPVGIAAIAAGAWLQTMAFSFPWLLWLGLAPTGLYTFDYYPLLPWLGVMMLGVYAGQKLYANKRTFVLPELGNAIGIKQLAFLGKNSLLIYLLHQPVLVLLVALIK